MEYHYKVEFIDDNGKTVVKEVEARNEFEATQLAGAFGKVVITVVNLDL